MVSELQGIPDITFIDDLDITDIQAQMVSDYEKKYEEVTGEKVTLAKADPYRLILYACSVQQFQMLKYLDEMGKQNLLKYAEGAFLDQIAALRGIKRLDGSRAVTTLRFELAEARTSATSIPEGVRVTGGEWHFSTQEYAEILAGELFVDVKAVCTEIGAESNGLMPGELKELVDSVPFVSGVKNITETSGGADAEDDESFTERIYLAPASYSTAGPEDAYKYFVKEANAGVLDVSVTSPSAGVVDIRFITEDGLPTQDVIDEVKEYVSADIRRPLTDMVQVSSPDIVEYGIDVKYWVPESKKSIIASVQEEVTKAVEEYVLWQRSKIGRDINPSELIYRIISAGAKRVEVISPDYKDIGDTEVATLKALSVACGGVESD